jgi:hypothetical protein
MHFDHRILNITVEPGNKTHEGRMLFDLYQDLPTVIVRIILTSGGTTFIDQNLDYCKWLKYPRVGFIIEYFDNRYRQFINPKLLDCPIKKGFYVGMEARPTGKKAQDYATLPSFIKIQGTYNYTQVLKTKIKNKVRPFFMMNFINKFG